MKINQDTKQQKCQQTKYTFMFITIQLLFRKKSQNLILDIRFKMRATFTKKTQQIPY